MKKKRFLFYLVHPAKFHFHRVQINELIARGHQVDIVINTKDILEDLVLEEGWDYKNIFPKSRKIKGVHVYVAAVVSIYKTVYRLWKYTKGKKYDLFIGDLTTMLGRIKGVPSLYPTDDVLAAVPEQVIFFKTTTQIIAPVITDVGSYERKKIGYLGYKALAHLHPNHFTPDITKLSPELRGDEPFFLIRCTGFGATHDLNKSGISDGTLFKLVDVLKAHGKILITSERQLPEELKEYQLEIRKNDISHYLYHAKIFIGDSTTMCTEAVVLGTPAVEFDEYFFEIEQMLEIERKYGLLHCFRTNQEGEFIDCVEGLVNEVNLEQSSMMKREVLLNENIDVSTFLIWLFEDYATSVNEYFKNPSKVLERFN